ncbi:MAG: hypothetical protein V7647_3609 [Acidobacteriota bacterium]|jgi:hypothetical protein
MSPAVRHRLYRRWSRLCIECREQQARFKFRGRVRADRDHTLCFRCFRAEVDRQRAARQALAAAAANRQFHAHPDEGDAVNGTKVPVWSAA